MRTERDVDRIVPSWLHADEQESAHRVLHDVLALLDTTPQRRAMGPAQRVGGLSSLARLAVAAAAIVTVAFVGIDLLPASRGPAGASPTTAASAPAGADAFVPEGPLAIGSHRLIVQGVPFSFSVPTSGWASNGAFYISKSTAGPQGAEAVIFWTGYPQGVYAVPCPMVLKPVSASMADLATAVSTVPSTELAGAWDVNLGGRAAKQVAITVREDGGCDPGFFYTWYDLYGGMLWTSTNGGDAISVWIVDVDGTILFIEGETTADASPALQVEIQRIVGSMLFD